MTKFKKMMSLTLAGCMAASALMMNAGAVSVQDSTPMVASSSAVANYSMPEQKLNEYQMLKSLNKELHERTLDTSALNDEQRQTILDYKDFYIEKIQDLKSFSDDELRNLNYNEEQISAIRLFDTANPDEALITQAATVVTVNGDFTSYTHSSKGTTAKFVAEFNCEGIQSNWFKDIFAVAWNTPLNATSLSGYVDYKTASGFRQELKATVDDDQLYGSSITFSKYVYDNIHKATAYIVAGSIIGTLHSNTDVKDITGLCSYGYNTIRVTPSVSFTASSISPGLSFSTDIVKLDSHRFYR